jgi:exopolysaccharide biosynthesis polyprenyl glycosylphosphotransferase
VLAYLAESALIATPLGAQVIAVTLLSVTMLTLLFRLVGRTVVQAFMPAERCLLVGSADSARRLGEKLGNGQAVKAQLVGRIALEPSASDHSIGTLEDLGDAVRRMEIDRVVIEGDTAPPETVHEAIQSAKAMGVNVSLLPRMFEIVGSSVAFDHVGGMTFLGVRRFGLSRRARFVKRSFDLAGSGALVVLLSPVFAALALAVRLTSRGPILFRQTRVGRDGERFEMLKFRSMVRDAEERKRDLFDLNEAQGLFKIEDDPRITRVGKLLRRTQLDELPQLINVLTGKMSLVGPRPLVLDEDELIRGWHRRRLHLTPGMTGPWQIAGAARIPLREMVAIDYLYVATWSLWGDIKILLRTVPCVLARRGQ